MDFKKSPQNNPFWIGVASFFGGISQDMILPVLPLYFTNVLRFDKSFIGLIDGMVTGSATIFKIIAGYLSDRLQTRKSIILIGYALSWVSRPLLAVTGSPVGVVLVRSLDGIGKGVKDSPKEALIADSAKAATRGKEFGIVRMLDTFGSVVGPALLALLFFVLPKNTTTYHLIFVLTALPLAVTLYILRRYVVEVPATHTLQQITKPAPLPRTFYIFVAISLLFAVGNFSDSFFILRAQQAGLSAVAISLLYALFNMVYATMAVPFGSISDKIGRIKTILLGWAVFIAIHLAFVVVTATYAVVLLFIAYGLYYAITFGAARACIADIVPAEHRGKAYGIYNAVTGLAALPASYCAGRLWDAYGAAAPFLYGAIMAGIAFVVLAFFMANYPVQTQK